MPEKNDKSNEPRHTLPRENRVRRPGEFSRVYGHRCAASTGPIVVHVRRNDLGKCRLGLTVSRKVGGAVVRNRWKRLLREAFRHTRHELPQGIDFVVTVRGSDPPPKLAWLIENLPRTARRAIERLEKPRGGNSRNKGRPRRRE